MSTAACLSTSKLTVALLNAYFSIGFDFTVILACFIAVFSALGFIAYKFESTKTIDEGVNHSYDYASNQHSLLDEDE